MDNQDLQDNLVNQALKALKVYVEKKAQLDRKVHQDLQDQLVHWDPRAILDRGGSPGHQAQLDSQDKLDSRVQEGLLVEVVLLVREAWMGAGVHKALKVHPDKLDLQVHQDLTVREENEVRVAHKVSLDL
jgi:hypothetical protein